MVRIAGSRPISSSARRCRRIPGPRPTPPSPHQGQAEHPGHQHRVKKLAAPHLAVRDRAGAAAHHGEAQRNEQQRNDARIEEVTSPHGGRRPETAEQRADKRRRPSRCRGPASVSTGRCAPPAAAQTTPARARNRPRSRRAGSITTHVTNPVSPGSLPRCAESGNPAKMTWKVPVKIRQTEKTARCTPERPTTARSRPRPPFGPAGGASRRAVAGSSSGTLHRRAGQESITHERAQHDDPHEPAPDVRIGTELCSSLELRLLTWK